MNIRTYTPADYPGLSAVYQATIPDDPASVEDFEHDDNTRDPKCKFERWVAEADGNIVGSVEYSQRETHYHPQKFWIDGCVHPDHQNQGIGTQLLNTVLDGIKEHDPIQALIAAEESQPHVLNFFEKHGFVEFDRAFESYLNLGKLDVAQYKGLIDSLTDNGITIVTYADYGDPQRDQKIFETWWEMKQDEPAVSGDPTPISFEMFKERWFKSPQFKPDAFWVALDVGEVVGMSNLWHSEPDKYIWIGFTGTVRTHRGKRIGTALKLKGIDYANANGYPQLRTSNNSRNAPMLAINEKMGFERQPAIVVYEKTF